MERRELEKHPFDLDKQLKPDESAINGRPAALTLAAQNIGYELQSESGGAPAGTRLWSEEKASAV